MTWFLTSPFWLVLVFNLFLKCSSNWSLSSLHIISWKKTIRSLPPNTKSAQSNIAEDARWQQKSRKWRPALPKVTLPADLPANRGELRVKCSRWRSIGFLLSTFVLGNNLLFYDSTGVTIQLYFNQITYSRTFSKDKTEVTSVCIKTKHWLAPCK